MNKYLIIALSAVIIASGVIITSNNHKRQVITTLREWGNLGELPKSATGITAKQTGITGSLRCTFHANSDEIQKWCKYSPGFSHAVMVSPSNKSLWVKCPEGYDTYIEPHATTKYIFPLYNSNIHVIIDIDGEYVVIYGSRS